MYAAFLIFDTGGARPTWTHAYLIDIAFPMMPDKEDLARRVYGIGEIVYPGIPFRNHKSTIIESSFDIPEEEFNEIPKYILCRYVRWSMVSRYWNKNQLEFHPFDVMWIDNDGHVRVKHDAVQDAFRF